MAGKLVYDLLLEKGICTTCTTRMAIKTKKTCEVCTEYRQQYYKKRSEPGTCWQCKNKLSEEEKLAHNTKCQSCRDKIRIRDKKTYEKRKQSRICVSCKKNLDTADVAKCVECKKKTTEHTLLSRQIRKIQEELQNG